jgi:predicted permease
MSWVAGIRARLVLLLGRRAVESRIDEEVHFHVEMETERLIRESGFAPDEARRRALVAFGGVEQHKEALRAGRGLSSLHGISLDLRLGVRMLVKYPGLTIVAVVGLSVAVAIGAVSFSMIYTVIDPTLPLDEGDRIVAIESVEPIEDAGQRTHLHDLTVWREDLTAIELLGAYRTIGRNLITGDRPAEPVHVAEMTATGFRVGRVPPLLGRYLLDDDERNGAPPVVVIGYEVWQGRFAADSAIVGRTIELGATRHTIVGVMPDGFAFPVRHRFWTPLQLDPLDFERGEAPSISVFGRLAPTASLEEAQTQLTTIAQRLAAEHPGTPATLRTRVMPYVLYFAVGGPDVPRVLQLVQLLLSMLLVLIGTNVAILVYARTANRAGEIAVRSALGASRGRIVAQLSVEALVLSSAAAAVGLVLAASALRQVDALAAREETPFWMTFGISPGVLLYSAGLAVVGAVIVGVVPALKATRHRVHAGLQQLGMGGSGMRLGKSWTFLIVAQVAAAVAILPVAFHVIDLVSYSTSDPEVATKGLLSATLSLDRVGPGPSDADPTDDQEFRSQFARRRAELVRRLEAEPGVANVFLDDGPPFPSARNWTRIEIEGAGTAAGHDSAPSSRRRRLQLAINLVDADYFETFEVPLLAGRRFQPGDVSGSAKVAIVEEAFVEQVLHGGAALGYRVRRVTRSRGADSGWVPIEPWHEVVGVVADFPTRRGDAPSRDERPRVYLPLPEETHPSRLLVQVRSDDPAAFAARLRELTVTLDPMLRLEDVHTLEASLNDDEGMARLAFLTVVGVTLSILLLSAGGIYALMSFTVTRRRREIGIRSALGAGPRRVAASVLARAGGQIGLGIVLGTLLAGVLVRVLGSVTSVMRDLTWVDIVGLLVAVAVVVTAVGLAAALGPARRALQIPPTEALKTE